MADEPEKTQTMPQVVEVAPETQESTQVIQPAPKEQKKRRSFPNQLLTDEVVNKCLELVAEGKTDREIAKFLGCNPAALSMLRKRKPLIKLNWNRAKRASAHIIERRMFNRAYGMKLKEQVLSKSGELVERWREIAPEPAAAAMFLKARLPEIYGEIDKDTQANQQLMVVTVSGSKTVIDR